MPLDKSKLPDPEAFFSEYGGKTLGKSIRLKCPLHNGDNPGALSVDRATGAWRCFGCDAKGGDVLDFVMQLEGIGFVHAASKFGAWTPDGQAPSKADRPTVNARALLNVLEAETIVAAMLASDIVAGRSISKDDRDRLQLAAGRIQTVRMEAFK
jgi:hypothetical protein